MAVLYEFRLPRAGDGSYPGLVELSCLWIQSGRAHAIKIAPERLALVLRDGVFFLIDPVFSCSLALHKVVFGCSY